MKPILLVFFVCCACLAYTQVNPLIEWQTCLGGSINDWAYDVKQTTDSGYIVVGTAYSADGQVMGHHGTTTNLDYWVVRLDKTGAMQWQKCLGGSGVDEANSVQQTKDGGYIVAGNSWSADGDVKNHHGQTGYGGDYWIIKLDIAGNIQWQRSLGGSDDDEASCIQQTKDGGYIVAGFSNSIDGDITGHHGDFSFSVDYWVVKLDNKGRIQWQKSLGGYYDDAANSIQQTKDGGYIVAGWSTSNDGDVSGHHGDVGDYNYDYWIVKLDSSGNIQSQKSLGGSARDEAKSIRQTKDGGYIIAGWSQSVDGDVSGNHTSEGYPGDYWIVKLNASGTIKWQKCLGSNYNDIAYSICETADGGYAVAGYAGYGDGDVTGFHGSEDFWIVKLSNKGNLQTEECFGGPGWEEAYSIQQTKDGGFIIAGYSSVNGGDVSGNHGGDYWVVKLKSSKNIAVSQTQSGESQQEEIDDRSSIHVQPNPSYNGIFTVNLGTVKNNILISVTDNFGRQIYAKQLSSAQQVKIHLNNEPKGIYYLHISYTGGEANAKLVTR
jgi:Secretion system C-terminal sorting domain